MKEYNVNPAILQLRFECPKCKHGNLVWVNIPLHNPPIRGVVAACQMCHAVLRTPFYGHKAKKGGKKK